ncbi:hypothetical protein MASR2M70_12960 [Bacillota bacterium]
MFLQLDDIIMMHKLAQNARSTLVVKKVMAIKADATHAKKSGLTKNKPADSIAII